MRVLNKHKVEKIKVFSRVLFCAMFIWNLYEMDVYAEKEQEPAAVLYSASDFQNPNGHEAGTMELEKITEQIYSSGYTCMTEALICGDYNASDDESEEITAKGVEIIKDILEKQWGLGYEQIFFVQGNHDPYKFENMDKTGEYEREHYSIYQINYRDFGMRVMDYINEEELLIDASKDLKEWLDEKIIAEYSKPIFIITHLPLHNSYRYDNSYAEHLFDVINNAAARGLNVIYLFGHNHAEEYDNYLGGDAICLTKGDMINIPDVQGNNSSDYKTEKLNFTYINAGYLSRPEEDLISSCIFEIYEDRVEIQRYTAEGLCNLKNEGNSSKKDGNWEANEKIVESPETIMLNEQIISIKKYEEILEELFIDLEEKEEIVLSMTHWLKDVTWTSSNPKVATVESNQSDLSKVTICGRKYGKTVISAQVDDLTVSIPVFVMPKNAKKISYSDKIRIYALSKDIGKELENQQGLSEEYLILNRGKQGHANALAVQDNEMIATESITVVYIPGIGEIATPKEMKHLLWQFEKIEKVEDLPTQYAIKMSEKSPYRYRYYLAATSAVDSSLSGDNINKMRLHSSDVSQGSALFSFDKEESFVSSLVSEYHYNNSIRKNENGQFVLFYDEINQIYTLDNTLSGGNVYFYEKSENEISDLIFWTTAEKGKIYVESDLSTETGGSICVIYEDVVEEVPITLEMLSGYDVGKTGTYNCSISYNGETISAEYELVVEEEPLVIVQWLEWIRGLIMKIFY